MKKRRKWKQIKKTKEKKREVKLTWSGNIEAQRIADKAYAKLRNKNSNWWDNLPILNPTFEQDELSKEFREIIG